MKNCFCLVLLLTFSTIAFCQTTKLKKKIFYVDGVAELNLKSCPFMHGLHQSCLVKSAKTDQPLFSTYVVNAGQSGFIVDISFVDFDLELRAEGMLFKKLFTRMYEVGVVNEDGSVNEENARKFARAFDIRKERKIIII